MKRNRTYLLSGVAMVAVMSSVQELKGAEVEQKLVVNVCKSISEPSVLPAFVKAEWSNDQEAGEVTLKKLTLDNPDKITDLTLVISAKDSQQSIGIGEYCFKFDECSSEKMRVHFVFEGDGDKRIMMPGNCHALFAGSNGGNAINSIDFSGVDTSRVTSMTGMFAGCKKIRELDLRTFDTSNVLMNGVHYMFMKCSMLKELNISSFTKLQKSLAYEMFNSDATLMNQVHIIMEDEPVKKEDLKALGTESVSNSAQAEIIKQEKNEDLHINQGNVLNNDDEHKNEMNLKRENTEKDRTHSDSTNPVKDTKIIKQENDERKTPEPTIDAKYKTQKKHWYDPFVTFFKRLGRKILSWF